MNMRPVMLALASTLAAAPLFAQQGPSLRLAQAQAQEAKYVPALCNIKASHAKVKKGEDLLKKSYDAKTPTDKLAQLTEARTNLVSAISADGQGTNAAAWYYLARVALWRGDAAEADSAFTKAEELSPSCELNISQYRQRSWAALANDGIAFQQKGQNDSAMALFREASIMFRGLPHVYSSMGIVFANVEREDSAAVYFQKALAIAEKDTSLTDERNSAALNLGVMHSRLGRHKEAISLLNKYLGWKPGDNDARKRLAWSFRQSGMPDSADAIDNAMVAEFAKQDLDSLETNDLMDVGVAAFNAKRYTDAETAFAKSVARNPNSRESLFNLANTYFAQGNHAKLVEYASRLLELEPMNEDVLKLVAQGQRGLNKEADVIKTATRLVMMPFGVEVRAFQPSAAGARFEALATGRSPVDAAGKPIKTEPLTIVIEFLDKAGAVVDTKEATVPVLAEKATHTINAEGKGAGILAWRYRAK